MLRTCVSPVRSRASLAALAILAFALGGAPAASALPFTATCVTNFSASDCGFAEDQLALELTDAGPGQVRITLANEGPEEFAYTRLLVDDNGFLSGVVAIYDDPPGVDFVNSIPVGLPAGNSLVPPFTSDFEIVALNPGPHHGVGPGESLEVILGLAPGVSFEDLVAALFAGDVRIGLKAQGFASGGNESLIAVPVPELSTSVLLGVGLAGLIGAGRRR